MKRLVLLLLVSGLLLTTAPTASASILCEGTPEEMGVAPWAVCAAQGSVGLVIFGVQTACDIVFGNPC